MKALREIAKVHIANYIFTPFVAFFLPSVAFSSPFVASPQPNEETPAIRCSDLCDFCNAQEFFYGSHGAGQIFYSDVMNLLQQGGLSS
jgi:hypothetical protein